MPDRFHENMLRTARIILMGAAGGVLAVCAFLAYHGAWDMAFAFAFIAVMIAIPPEYDPAVRLKERLTRR